MKMKEVFEIDEKIESLAYRLVEPYQFIQTIQQHGLQKDEVVVQPKLASICHADLRYFTGNRRQKALAEKLPMALFHEGIGIVTKSKNPFYKIGDRVVIVPSIPGYRLNHHSKETCCEHCRQGGHDNYCLNGVFLGSGYDGIGQSHLVIHGDNLVHVPEEVDDAVAVLAELCSVSLFAIRMVNEFQSSLNQGGKVAIFGDGPVGYLTATILRYVYNVPKEQLIVFGAVKEKIIQFRDFATVYLVNDIDFSEVQNVTTIFECTGGNFSSTAINQAIELIEREGTIVLMGVSEEWVPINTRDVLEKGVQILGSSRSTTEEFKLLMDAFKNKHFQKVLQRLIPDEYFHVQSVEDLTNIMEDASQNKGWEKIYLSFDWR